MESLLGLDKQALHDAVQQRGKEFAGSRWDVAVCLLAVERKGVHFEHDCSSVPQYAERYLRIEAYAAIELLRVAKALEKLPELSEAFRLGEISWTSIREITRRAEACTDAEWAELGRRLTTTEIQRLCVRSPRAWEREQALRDKDGDDEIPAWLTDGIEESDASDQDVASATPAEVAPTQPTVANGGVGTGLDLFGRVSDAGPAPAVVGATRVSLPGGMAPSIGLGFQLAPEVYQLFKEVQGKIRAGHPGPMTREQVFEEICSRALAGSGKKSRTRTIVVLHFDPRSGAGWTETDRGVVAVAPEVIAHALETGTVVVAPGEGATRSVSRDAMRPDAEQPSTEISAPKVDEGVVWPSVSSSPGCGQQPPVQCASDCDRAPTQPVPESDPVPTKPASESAAQAPARSTRKSKRRGRCRISASTMIALYARSSGRCELCGACSYLHVHHRKATSRGGGDELDDVLLICSRCHDAAHRRDFENDASWSAARQRGREAVGWWREYRRELAAERKARMKAESDDELLILPDLFGAVCT